MAPASDAYGPAGVYGSAGRASVHGSAAAPGAYGAASAYGSPAVEDAPAPIPAPQQRGGTVYGRGAPPIDDGRDEPASAYPPPAGRVAPGGWEAMAPGQAVSPQPAAPAWNPEPAAGGWPAEPEAPAGPQFEQHGHQTQAPAYGEPARVARASWQDQFGPLAAPAPGASPAAPYQSREIPPYQVSQQQVPLQGPPRQAPPYQGGPYQEGPYQEGPYQEGPYQGGPQQGPPRQDPARISIPEPETPPHRKANRLKIAGYVGIVIVLAAAGAFALIYTSKVDPPKAGQCVVKSGNSFQLVSCSTDGAYKVGSTVADVSTCPDYQNQPNLSLNGGKQVICLLPADAGEGAATQPSAAPSSSGQPSSGAQPPAASSAPQPSDSGTTAPA